MTNLSNAEKYTPQYGFEDGVVVEVIDTSDYRHVGIFLAYDKYGIALSYASRPDGGPIHTGHVDANRIKSLRILSGAFAIWQFAPKSCIGISYEARSGVPWLFWAKHSKHIFEDRIANPTDSVLHMRAPWWHQPKETKNAKED